MIKRRLQSGFELEATSEYGISDVKPTSKEIEYWLNCGKDKFVKTRYSGFNIKSTGYEQDQKRIDDLRLLTTTSVINTTKINDSKYEIELPNNYMFATGESASIYPLSSEAKKCWLIKDGDYIQYLVPLMECVTENIDEKLINKLSDHRLQYDQTRPLRLYEGNKVYLFSDGNYSIPKFFLTYIRYPEYIDLHNNPESEYTDLPEHTQGEIIKLAVQLYLENKTNPRYNTFSNEVNSME